MNTNSGSDMNNNSNNENIGTPEEPIKRDNDPAGELFSENIPEEISSLEKPKRKLSVSLGAFVVSMAFAVIITFMVTCITVSNYKDRSFSSAVDEINEKLDLVNSSVLGVPITDTERLKLYQYILELDTIFSKYEFNEYEYSLIADYMLSAYTAAVGDDYAEYYNAEVFEQMISSMQGENQGVGINITYDADHDAISVINVMPGSPAEKAGMLPGDLIVTVGIGENAEEVSSIGYSAAIMKLQGVKGTNAEFTVLRDGKRIEFSILRDEYKNQSVLSHIYALDSSVGVIRILNFDALTPEQFEKAMEDMYKQGIRKIVFDVRNNPGGNLNAIVDVLDMLLPEGPIIRIVDKNGNVVQQINSDKDAKYTDVKFAVIANGNTASAAELFTSALMDYDRATVVGTKTFGKGSMQSTLNLSDDRGIKLTTYHYLPPYSEGYDGKGIIPDVDVEMAEEFKDKNIFLIEDKDDNQLKAAVESIN